MNSTTPNSPLAEAKKDSLDYLFSADPETLEDADIEKLVLDLRAKRTEFNQAKAEKSTKKAIPIAENVDELMDLLDLRPKK